MSDLVIAVVIGLAFGFAIERAGLGSARKLTGQFFLTDLTVFKVMFTAIVTAMLGTFWLGRLGLLDLELLSVPDTYLGAQVTGLFFAPLQRLYESGAHGAWTLPQLLDLPYGIVVFGVVVVALAGFLAAERIEART
jgi:hypothetical protein